MKFGPIALALTLAVAGAQYAVPASAQEIVLKASHNANADEPYGKGMIKMGELLKEKSGGKAEIQVFHNAQLGDEMESIQGTQVGTIDIAVTANETLVNFVPDLSVFSLPFLFKDADQMNRAMSDPEVIAAIQDILKEKGFHLVSLFSAGTRHIMTKTPLNSMADIKGLKIRTMQNQAHLDTFKAFGANPTPLAYTELYGALETGVVDGAEAANTNYYAKKFYEVSPDWAIIGWLELVAPVIMGEDAYQALPADVQKALDAAGIEAGVYQRKLYKDSDAARLADIAKEGVTVTHPDDKPFREAAAPIVNEYVKTDAQKKLFQLIEQVK